MSSNKNSKKWAIEVDLFSIVRDLGSRQFICDYFMQQINEICWAYIRVKPYQPIQSKFSDYIDKNVELTPLSMKS